MPRMGVASMRTDSPAHIYEEILLSDSDNENSNEQSSDSDGSNRVDKSGDNSTEKVNVANLDFNHAKDFGSFLVVPIRSRLQHQSDSLPEENNNKGPDLAVSSPCDIKPPSFPREGGDSCLDNVSCTYPGDLGSSGDSAIADMSTSHDHSSDTFPHVHCARCRRPHGIFNGVTLSHIDEKTDMENLEIQTYFNKQMLQDDGDHTVERFLIVPSVSEPEHTDGRVQGGMQHQDILNDNGMKNKETTQGSDDSNDTCNEYDIRSSDMSSSSHSRPGSYAFDSGSSLYAFSNSDKDLLPMKTGMAQLVRRKVQESDSSNDTFSEYDSHPSGGEYEYYLSKAEHNLWLKRDVMRVIRESESSEYETTDSQVCQCECLNRRNSDNSSLTTITSLSDLSLSDKDENSVKQKTKKEKHKSEHRECKNCACPSEGHKKSSRHKTKVRTKHKHHNSEGRSHHKQSRVKEASASAASAVPAWERDDGSKSAFTEYKNHAQRKSRVTSHKKRAELYCLPDFSDNSAPSSSRDSDSLEKLSCRATDFTPSAPQVSRSNSSRKLALDAKPSVSDRRHPRQNRILSDLMKMNHDRLLVQF